MLKAIKEYFCNIGQEIFAKQILFDLQVRERETARLKRTLLYYQVQQHEIKKALGLEFTSSYKELLEMAKDPANHQWKANSELITILVAALRRSDDQVLYFSQDELESANGEGVIADWDAERNCARIILASQQDSLVA